MNNNHWSSKLQNLSEKVGQISQVLGQKVSELGPLDEQLKTLLVQIDEMVKKQVKKANVHTLQNYPVKVKLLPNFSGNLPAYESEWASGFDVRAQVAEDLVLKPGERSLIPTGLAFEIPKGFELQARPRSGLAIKQGVSLVNTPGTIDADYRGEVKIIVINLGQEPVTIKAGDRIAQLVLCPIYHAEFELVENLGETSRGEGGFGHTGV